MTTRRPIDELRSAQLRREHYVGEWLPEPIITDGHDDPPTHVGTSNSLSLALLVLLESLSPKQRAAHPAARARKTRCSWQRSCRRA